MSESATKSAAISALRDLGYYAIRLPANAGMPAGTPDVLVLLKEPRGRALFLEFKHGDGKLSRLQVAQIEQLKKAGAAVCVVRSVREAIRAATYSDIGIEP